ncbi:MAG TPA: DUF1565 domain-containing protein [Bryobacteraceae bacterium]|nr:DUF1565 domain-containing protein [Bryobacteraceae bacterium]
MTSFPAWRAAVLLALPLALRAATWYIDANSGEDSNSGTSAAPWKTITKATGGAGAPPSIQPGDTVILRAGIYRVASGTRCVNGSCFPMALLSFLPAGTAPSPTGYRADLTPDGAYQRVIVTSDHDFPVNITLGNYVRVEGLWFGGVQDIGPINYNQGPYVGVSTGPIDHSVALGGADPKIAQGVQIVNCTIWGYHSGVITGSVQYALFQGNRLVNNGDDGLWHGIYLSGGDGRGAGQSNHIIVDNNLLIGWRRLWYPGLAFHAQRDSQPQLHRRPQLGLGSGWNRSPGGEQLLLEGKRRNRFDRQPVGTVARRLERAFL